MAKSIAIVQGHPDPAGGHLCHALADSYAEGAIAGGHSVTRIDLATLDPPMLRTREDFESGAPPPALAPACAALAAADHILIVFPLWLGTMPALVKLFLEQAFRPGVAFAYQPKGMPKKLFAGKSARVVVTMAMPAMAYRLFYAGHGVRGLKRSILNFVGVNPVRLTYFGMVEAVKAPTRTSWIASMRGFGAAAS